MGVRNLLMSLPEVILFINSLVLPYLIGEICPLAGPSPLWDFPSAGLLIGQQVKDRGVRIGKDRPFLDRFIHVFIHNSLV